jgi:hypothetical protein
MSRYCEQNSEFPLDMNKKMFITPRRKDGYRISLHPSVCPSVRHSTFLSGAYLKKYQFETS